MIAFQVSINGKLITLAGKNDLSVLNTIVGAVGILGSESIGTVSEKDKFQLNVTVGGLSAKSNNEPGEHLRWLDQKIGIGDEISIRVIESNNSDDPLEEKKVPADELERQKLKSWESARDYYLKFKDKYESENG